MKNGRNSKGQFTSDNKGRPRGSQNKERKELREAITRLLQDNYERFAEAILNLNDERLIDKFILLLEYATPKLNRTDLTNDGEKFDFTGTSDAELINELEQFTKFVSGQKKVLQSVN